MKVGELFTVLAVDMTQYEKDLAVAQTKARATGSTISDIFKNALSFTVGMGLYDAIRNGFRSLISTALDFNVMMQNARIGFETMLGSAQRAQNFLDQMAKFAAATPFEFPDLLQASRQLMAFGYAANDVLPIVKSVGDAVAALGGSKEQINNIIYALGQMRTAGRLNAQDMMQLTNAGIPAWEILAEKMGKSVAEVRNLSEQGLIPAAQAIPILIEGMEKRFPNMMEKMQDTWLGVTSTIKDIWRMTIGAVTQSLFQGLNNWLKGVRDWATQFYAAFQQGGLMFAIQKMFGSDVATVVSVVAGTLKTLWNVLVGIANFIRTHWSTLKPILIGVLSTLLYFKSAAILQSAFKSVASGLQDLRYNLKLFIMGLRDIPGIVAKVRAAITMLTGINPVFLVITAAIAGVIVAGVLLYRNWDKVRYYGLQAWGALKIGIAYVAYAIVSYYKIILGWIPILGQAFNRMQQSLASSIAKEKSILSQRAGAFTNDNSDAKTAQNLVNNQRKLVDSQKQIANASSNAATGLNKQADATKKAGKATQDNLQSFDEVHQIMQETADASKDAADNIELPETSLPSIDMGGLGSIGTDLGGIANSIENITSSIADKVSSIWDTIKTKAEAVWNGLTEFFSNLWDKIKTNATNAWDGIASFLTNTWQSIYAAAPQFWDALRNYFVTLWTGIVNIGVAIWNGLVVILQSTWQTIYTIAINVWGLIRDFLMGNWQGVRAHAVAIWEAIKNYFIAVWNVLVGIASTTWNSIASIIQSYITLMKVTIETIWAAVKGFLSDTWAAIKNTAIPLWAAIKEAVIKPIQDAYNSLVTVWDTIKTFVLNKWSEIRSGILSTGSNLWNAITKPFYDAKATIGRIIDDAFNWGRNLMSNIISGITSMISRLWDTVSNVANTIKGFLGFHSPTELGPGRDADKWAPNFMRMYAQGITGNINIIESAVNTVASKLSNITATYPIAVAGRTIGSGYTTPVVPQPEIHLHIGTLIADDYGLKKLEQRLREIRIFEEQRLGSDNR